MAYRLADPSVAHALETRHRMDAESGEFHFLLQRPRRPEAKRPESRLDAVMAMVALSAPVWCPIATYLCARFGGDGSATFAGVLGFVVGIGVAVTALRHRAAHTTRRNTSAHDTSATPGTIPAATR